MESQKRVLFAHQSTIPHYRVPFYNALEKQRPDKWCFSVVFDPREFESPIFFKEPLEKEDIQFPLLDVKTYSKKISGVRISYQTFFRRAANYDLVVVENAVNNLTYPLSQLHQLRSTKFAYWGHGQDLKLTTNPGPIKKTSEAIKFSLLKKADAFFAYTDSVKSYLLGKNLPEEKIFVVDNSIDIQLQRTYFNELQSQRDLLRQDFGVADKRVLVFVGRFSRNKRLDFLLAAFRCLIADDSNWHLFLVGGGDIEPNLEGLESHVTTFGSVTDLGNLAPIYVASDLYVMAGAVGLGTLQANCYDLPVVVMDSPFHGPEFVYLNPTNAVILEADTNEIGFADAINQLFLEPKTLLELRASVWPSVSHLTIENMANCFSAGIDRILFAD